MFQLSLTIVKEYIHDVEITFLLARYYFVQMCVKCQQVVNVKI